MSNKVLIFDSGKGGEYVALEAKNKFPDLEIDFLSDKKGMPYGDKAPDEIIRHALDTLSPVIGDYDIVVIACHTLTELGIAELRVRFKNTKFIGFDPGIKKAYDLGFRDICVLATPASLTSERYINLKSGLNFTKVIEPDCSSWASAIENGQFKFGTMVDVIIKAQVACVVLACTHYFWYEEELNQYFDDIAVINPTKAVLNQLGKSFTSSIN